MTVKLPATEKHQAGQQLDEEIADGNWRAAVPALAAQRKPCHQRNIQKPWDRIAAVRTMRWWRNNTLPQRQPMNADVKKAADNTAESKENERPKLERNTRPIVRIENGFDH